MPEEDAIPSHPASLEPQPVKLPATPTFPKSPKTKEEEHKRRPKPSGPYRPIDDLGTPTRAPEAGNDSPYPKR